MVTSTGLLSALNILFLVHHLMPPLNTIAMAWELLRWNIHCVLRSLPLKKYRSWKMLSWKQHDGKYQLKHNHGNYYQCQLQLFMTGRSFCNFLVWTKEELHMECMTLDEALIKSALPIAQKFYKLISLCILPELLGKWYTCPRDTASQRTIFANWGRWWVMVPLQRV